MVTGPDLVAFLHGAPASAVTGIETPLWTEIRSSRDYP